MTTEGFDLDGANERSDDKVLDYFQLRWYITKKNEIDKIIDAGEKQRESNDFDLNPEAKKIQLFLDVVNMIEDGGTLILQGCHVFQDSEGLEFSNNIQILTGKKITIIGPADFCRDAKTNSKAPENDAIFDVKLIPPKLFYEGYIKDSKITEKNLILKGTGDKLYELVPEN